MARQEFKLAYLNGASEESLRRLERIGLRRMQLRVGPGFPISSEAGEEKHAEQKLKQLRDLGIEIVAIGFYRNHLHPEASIRELEATRLLRVYDIAEQAGVKTISVFAGRDPNKSIEESISGFKELWAPLAEKAEARGLRLAFENCTMYRGYPLNGINLSYAPAAYRQMFAAVPSKALGVELDPSHLVKQRIDVVRFTEEFADRIYHVHAKDHVIDEALLYERGSFDPTTSHDRFPGFGSVDFRAMFAALQKGGYNGAVTIESEYDPDFHSEDEIVFGLRQSVERLHKAWESALAK